MKKQEVLTEILKKLKLKEHSDFKSSGSTVTKNAMLAILFKILEKKSSLLKHDVFKQICTELGITVSQDMLSSGSTITKEGLEEILKKI
jgi:hypothetical protein